MSKHTNQGMSDEWVLWLNGAEILPIQPSLAEWAEQIGPGYYSAPFIPIQPNSAGLVWNFSPIQPHHTFTRHALTNECYKMHYPSDRERFSCEETTSLKWSVITHDMPWCVMTYHDKYHHFVTKYHEISSSVTKYYQMSPRFKKHGDVWWLLVTRCDNWWCFMTFFDHQKCFKKHGDIWWYVMKVHDLSKPFQRGMSRLQNFQWDHSPSSIHYTWKCTQMLKM